ncbi:cytochrome c oxidase subunit CcoN [Photobacterium aphoticum]|uniref:Cytochrome c oxidase subunit CcoN n=1 Tax=Photobacterium aphoticum TaxID=754436 RepID=A0A090QHX6_9GAMM|nr:cytochrome c oxidase subunit CcoN [Photobacterium aphoticum]
MTDAPYSIKVVKYFIVASLVWAFIGMLIGVILAAQLYWPSLNFDSEYFQFGRLRHCTPLGSFTALWSTY